MTAASAGLLWAASYPITCPKRSAQLGTPEYPSAEHANSRASSDNGKLKNNIGRMQTAAPGKRDTVYKFHRSKSSHTHTWPCLTVPTPGLERVGSLLYSAEVYRTPESGPLSQESSSPPQPCAPRAWSAQLRKPSCLSREHLGQGQARCKGPTSCPPDPLIPISRRSV